jgi:hypothetical protein
MNNLNIVLNDRWKLDSLNLKASTFVVYDRLMKKKREFHVPFLCEVRVDSYMAYITTKDNKIMMLNLNTAERSFLN